MTVEGPFSEGRRNSHYGGGKVRDSGAVVVGSFGRVKFLI